MTLVTVGLCREEGLKEVAVWEEQSFARRDISCYDLRGHEGSLVLGAREIKNQWELLLEKNSERCWCWVCAKHQQHGRPGAELEALSSYRNSLICLGPLGKEGFLLIINSHSK